MPKAAPTCHILSSPIASPVTLRHSNTSFAFSIFLLFRCHRFQAAYFVDCSILNKKHKSIRYQCIAHINYSVSFCLTAKGHIVYHQLTFKTPSIKEGSRINRKSSFPLIARSGSSTSSEGSQSDSKLDKEKAEFGYSRKDVLLIGLGVTLAGFGMKYGLEFLGVDSLQAGNAVQLIIVLGLTIGWISSYMFRVANKDMTYAQQLRDYEKKVMEKRLESLTEADLEALLEQVEEEKTRLRKRRETSS